jgi:hypothetical protein
MVKQTWKHKKKKKKKEERKKGRLHATATRF